MGCNTRGWTFGEEEKARTPPCGWDMSKKEKKKKRKKINNLKNTFLLAR